MSNTCPHKGLQIRRGEFQCIDCKEILEVEHVCKNYTLEKNQGEYFVVYIDDGPAGACGQTVDITSPKEILLRFKTLEAAWTFMEKNKPGSGGRRNTRLYGVFGPGDGYCKPIWCPEEEENTENP